MLAGRLFSASLVKKLSDAHITVAVEENNGYHWDYTECFNVLSVMSLPSPNGSCGSVLSSEDSSSTTSTNSSSRLPVPQQQQKNYLPSSSSSSVLCSTQNSGKQIKFCRVCGDRAKSYHFGGISCDSCKAFFRRSVQNDAYRNFHCPYEGHCDISITSRKCCQHCRFIKCLSIGMEKSWVMSEDERLQMLKSRMDKKKQESEGISRHQIKNVSSSYLPDIKVINDYLDNQEIKEIENVMSIYTTCTNEIPFNSRRDRRDQPKSRTEILNIFFSAIQRFASFAKQFHSFNNVNQLDQEILLRTAVLELCFIRSAFSYNKQTKSWPDKLTDKFTLLHVEDLCLVVNYVLLEKHLNFIESFQMLNLDETSVMLFSVIILLSPDRTGLNECDLVQNEQEKYILLLKKYLNWRFGIKKSSLLFPKLLLKAADLRELAEAHTDYQLILCQEESDQIHHQLSTLHIDTAKVDSPTTFSWTIEDCLPERGSKCFSEEELSTSSEGSDRF